MNPEGLRCDGIRGLVRRGAPGVRKVKSFTTPNPRVRPLKVRGNSRPNGCDVSAVLIGPPSGSSRLQAEGRRSTNWTIVQASSSAGMPCQEGWTSRAERSLIPIRFISTTSKPASPNSCRHATRRSAPCLCTGPGSESSLRSALSSTAGEVPDLPIGPLRGLGGRECPQGLRGEIVFHVRIALSDEGIPKPAARWPPSSSRKSRRRRAAFAGSKESSAVAARPAAAKIVSA